MRDPATPLKRALRFLGSVQLAMLLLLGGVVVMAAGTIVESRHDALVARSIVYGALWFDLFLALVVVNLTMAVVNRIPIQRQQWSFVLTHFSIVLLLAGAWVSRTFGYEGRLFAAEGGSTSELVTYDSEIAISVAAPAGEAAGARDGKGRERQPRGTEVLALPFGHELQGEVLRREQDGRPGVRILEYEHDGILEPVLVDGPGSVAAEFQLWTEGGRLQGWVLAGNPALSRRVVGPAAVEILHLDSPGEVAGRLAPRSRLGAQVEVTLLGAGEPTRIELPARIGEEVRLDADTTAVVARYFQRARVVGSTLTEGAQGRSNPAAVVEIRRGSQVETHTVFSLYPDFARSHSEGGGSLAAEVLLRTPEATSRPLISVLVGPEHETWVQLTSAEGRGDGRPLAPGGTVEWVEPELRFTLERLYPSARVETTLRPARDDEENGRPTARLELSLEGGVADVWLPQGSSRSVVLAGREARAELRRTTLALPFALRLEEFRVDYHPGSRRPASYASKVRVAGLGPDGTELSTVISMNRPLDFMGFRLFQQSYVLGEGGAPDTTVLSVSRDPGVPVVYVAFILLILGVFWYLLGNGRRRVPHGSAAAESRRVIWPAPPARCGAAVGPTPASEAERARTPAS